MLFDVDVLKRIIKENETQRSLAEALGVSRQNLINVLSGKQDFTYPQLVFLAARYDLSPEQFFEIFIRPRLDDPEVHLYRNKKNRGEV